MFTVITLAVQWDSESEPPLPHSKPLWPIVTTYENQEIKVIGKKLFVHARTSHRPAWLWGDGRHGEVLPGECIAGDADTEKVSFEE